MFNSHFHKTYNKFQRVDKMISINLSLADDQLKKCMDKQIRRIEVLIGFLESEAKSLKSLKNDYKNGIHSKRDREYCMKNFEQLWGEE